MKASSRYNIQKYSITHPFGVNMQSNISSAKKMAKDFVSIAYKDLLKVTNVVLICMGSSGAIIATVFYNTIHKKYQDLNISVCHVKKENEDCHGERVSGFLPDDNTLYVWVDDFIESGETMFMCYEVIQEYAQRKGIAFEEFDYVVCSTIDATKCSPKKVEKLTKNIIYNYL